METYKEAIRRQSRERFEELKTAGITFENHPDFAEYIIMGDVITKADVAVGNIEDASEMVNSGHYENLNDAIRAITDENLPEIEICTNHEWLRVYGGYDGVEDTGNDEYDEATFDNFVAEMKNVISEKYTYYISAKKQRIMCHGWNGAAFTHQNSGLGTFDVLTEASEKLFDSI